MTETCGKFSQQVALDESRAFDELNFAGMGEDAAILFGPECEFFICKDDGGKLSPIGRAEADAFITLFRDETGTELHQEAIASHFELNYGPMALHDFEEKFENYFKSVRALYRIADREGFRVVPSSHAPHIKGADDVIDQLVDRERIRNIFPTARQFMGDSVIKFANLTAGIHVSAGYKDDAQFYDDLRRTYYLSPFIYALSDNGFPFWKGGAPTGGAIPRLAIIEQFAAEPKGRTGIDPLFFETASGEDFLTRYIERIMHSTILCFYRPGMTAAEIAADCAAPSLRPITELGATPARPMTFADLEKHGLNTLSNFQFAASSWWYGVKVQDIPGSAGATGLPLKRLEDRIWNAGTWQIPSAILMRALMTLEPDCGREIDGLLEKFGFHTAGPAVCPQSGEFLRRATREAAQHGGRTGLDFTYGHGSAQEFGRQFVTILKKYAARHDLSEYLAPMAYITETNRTDARVLAGLCETYDDVRNFVNGYDPALLANPRKCFGMLQDDGSLPAPGGRFASSGDKAARKTAPAADGTPFAAPG